MNFRFKYSHSMVYGWCVYDTALGNIPAYSACNFLLPLQETDWGAVSESPTMLKSEYDAMSLCRRLNHEWRLYCKLNPDEKSRLI